MDKILKFNEGFSGYTVSQSDAAQDLMFDVVKSILKVLKKEEKNKESSFNTHGNLNIAMILVEYLQEMIINDPDMCKYASDLSQKLENDVKKFKKGGDFEKDYIKACLSFSKKLNKIVEKSDF